MVVVVVVSVVVVMVTGKGGDSLLKQRAHLLTRERRGERKRKKNPHCPILWIHARIVFAEPRGRGDGAEGGG